MQVSESSKKILTIFFLNQDKRYFTNEIIRKTGLYPNSVQQSLLSLVKQGVLVSDKSSRFRFYSINEKYPFLTELKKIIGWKSEDTLVAGENRYDWAKILNRQTSYSFTAALCYSNIKNLEDVYGVSISNFWHNSITFGVYYLKKDLALLGKNISGKIEENLDFSKKDISLCFKVCDRLIENAKKIPYVDLAHKSDRELATIFDKFYQNYLEVFPFVTSPHGIESYFEKKIREKVIDEEDVKILLSPVSNKDEERNDAFKIAMYVKKEGFDNKFYKLLDKHCEKYCWLPLWSIYAKPLNREYFESEIKSILNKIDDPQKELERQKNEEKVAKNKLGQIFKKLKANFLFKEQVRLLQKYIYLRLYRKNTICQAHYYSMPLFYESAKRLGFDSEEVKLLSYEEIINGLLGKLSRKVISLLIEERKKGWAILVWDGKLKTVTGTKKIIETMERYQIIAPSSAMQRTVKGSVACRGRAIGHVKVITKMSELGKFREGDILVTKMTTPDYVVAMQKAAAIITDEGGITCHAAIVSREFNIPCVIATKNATQILSDNDLVEVDAIEGVIRVVEAVEVDEDIKIIPGKMIYKGKVKGRVRIILDASDFVKIQDGDILVAAQTTPEYLSSLYKVKGFIVDEDSLTSHAVLYGKALKLPSIMGTNYARNVLKDGEIIELDATNGIIKRKACQK